jgi:cytochrome oxidase Cu insertion factor (SCO1/SenC/PrrC family)
MSSPDRDRRGRRALLLVAALFLVPLASAFWLYYGDTGWRPVGGTQRGDLIEPARPLPPVSFLDADGRALSSELLRHVWTLLYIGDGRCDERCRRALYLMRQSRLALNRDAGRVQQVLLATNNCCDRAYLAREHPELVVATLRRHESAALLGYFPVYDGAPAMQAGRIYLIDPLGNLMMSYAAHAPDKALLEDLRKLLRLSHIG